MKKKLRKLYSFILCIAIIAISVTALPASALAATAVSFEDKIIFENEVFSSSEYSLMAENNEEIPESVSVTLRFDESFSCDHEDIDSDEELTAHRNELKEHYKALNEKIIAQLGLEDYEDISYSWCGPFIEYNYATYDDFIANDYDILANKNPAAMEIVYVGSNYPCEPTATVATTDGAAYPFSEALEDIGIINKQYTGSGVNVGIIDVGIPSSYANLIGTTYETYGTISNNTEDWYRHHSFKVASVLGGTSGIANGAALYFAQVEQYSDLIEAVEWLIFEKDVNVINKSIGHSGGTYDSVAAYIDYVVETLIVTFVTAAGNDRNQSQNTNLITNASTGLNTICVAASNKELNIYWRSSYLMTNEWEPHILKPTLTAPGNNIVGINNISGGISGTSYAAPMVTGVIALLMEQFPELKYSPEKVMAILASSCTPAAGQTQPVDPDAGFGIINYANAVEAYENSSYFNLSRAYSYGDLVVSRSVTLPSNRQTLIVAMLADNSEVYNLDEEPNSLLPITTPDFTELKLKVEISIPGASASIVYEGTRVGNYCYVLITNLSATVTGTIDIYCYDVKNDTTFESGAICYYSRT